MPTVKTIGVDFDGVLRGYTQGWRGEEENSDPVPGAISSLHILMEDYAVFVHTAREPQQVVDWLTKRGFMCRTDFDGEFWDTRGVLLVTNHKYVAQAYIDDRAIHFVTWDQTLMELERRGLMVRSEEVA